MKKFDPGFNYVRKWIPEFDTNKFPQRIIDHKLARERVIQVYKEALR